MLPIAIVCASIAWAEPTEEQGTNSTDSVRGSPARGVLAMQRTQEGLEQPYAGARSSRLETGDCDRHSADQVTESGSSTDSMLSKSAPRPPIVD